MLVRVLPPIVFTLILVFWFLSVVDFDAYISRSPGDHFGSAPSLLLQGAIIVGIPMLGIVAALLVRSLADSRHEK